MVLQTLEVSFERFLDVEERFAAGLPLGDAARQPRHLCDEHTVFVLLDQDSILHGDAPLRVETFICLQQLFVDLGVPESAARPVLGRERRLPRQRPVDG